MPLIHSGVYNDETGYPQIGASCTYYFIKIGLRRDGTPHIVHKWEPDAQFISVIRRAYEMRTSGATLDKIRKETRLYHSKNCYITFFNNPLYKGVLEFGDLQIVDYCNPIVSPELCEAANLVGRLRSGVRSGEHNPRRLNSPYLLSGLLFCEECGGPMNGYSLCGYDNYRCSRRCRTGDCHARSVPKHKIEDAIIQAVINQVLQLDNLLKIQASFHQQIHNNSVCRQRIWDTEGLFLRDTFPT